MQLSKYLSETGETVEDFAKRIEVKSINTVYRYMRGERIPTKEIMARIRVATGGKVQPNDFHAQAPSPERLAS